MQNLREFFASSSGLFQRWNGARRYVWDGPGEFRLFLRA